MLPLKYSKFFRSGFLAKERTFKPQPAQDESYAESSTPSRRSSILSIGSRRKERRQSRPISLVIPSFPSSGGPTSFQTTQEKRSSRRSFSSWLFDRKSTSSDESYLTFSNSPPPNRRELYDVPETLDVWITTGGPYTPKAIENRSNEDDFFSHSIDPFDPSPDSKSVLIDLPEAPTPTPTPPTVKQESFLCLSTPSANKSIVNINLFIPRQERPTSIQTMPLPARSRTSSIHRKSKSDKSRWSIATTADEPRSETTEPHQEDAASEWPDLTHLTDWRQFHLNLLGDD